MHIGLSKMIPEETWFQSTIEVYHVEHPAWNRDGFSSRFESLFKPWTRFAGYYGRRWLCERHGREIVIYEVIIRGSRTEKIYAAETEARERLQDIGDNLVGVCRRVRKWKLVRDVEAEWTLEEDGTDDLSKEMVGSKPPQWMTADNNELAPLSVESN
ncbi:hypothetical protein BDV24DRAFT_26751 [Aspergillus arachidicola]|uniref:Uncharacterized protein n=1 Tax=Aspergillus arachidicola TaxID=656916 RepID=A0A5N6XMH8_9EURO|nr:hypothetical protein BDV24DRAFT_26751 [Aspergillus arachidicola]